MPTQKQIQVMLEKMTVKDLRILSAYFGLKGGNQTKSGLVYGLVGGEGEISRIGWINWSKEQDKYKYNNDTGQNLNVLEPPCWVKQPEISTSGEITYADHSHCTFNNTKRQYFRSPPWNASWPFKEATQLLWAGDLQKFTPGGRFGKSKTEYFHFQFYKLVDNSIVVVYGNQMRIIEYFVLYAVTLAAEIQLKPEYHWVLHRCEPKQHRTWKPMGPNCTGITVITYNISKDEERNRVLTFLAEISIGPKDTHMMVNLTNLNPMMEYYKSNDSTVLNEIKERVKYDAPTQKELIQYMEQRLFSGPMSRNLTSEESTFITEFANMQPNAARVNRL